MREVKLIWDDREEGNEGWFAREYLANGFHDEWSFDAAWNASPDDLVEAARIEGPANIYIYHSVTLDVPSETITV